ncbi:hypothetical protein [Stutzerimonas kirkiae]|uniref:Uncharacterized protein n=1 Tax=Stutzerimonas kirkiae TaxID=2211392 RepID=A0A4Q9R0W8_9GAMM|nr:hypothetical protein [Stutzerimonas kirkiae]TBU90971.1 hypothetical protein DNJ96_16310 [Stutzerimonas kirkiae]TBV00307.1 hypothetical protein DNJ95_15250 [Stutzerimonas kirkiae]TBV10855.1 hypothetical protein DNK01_17145 [Stutzerimonas kirkiae]TBV12340.1 hypothetical protein DNK08_00440 [Stutzerimonas kirkiae]
MTYSFCLTRRCLGADARIECEVFPLCSDQGLWVLLCVAGMQGAQPSELRVQGPFRGVAMARSILDAIGSSLREQGYEDGEGPAMWQLHMRSELRRVNADQARLFRGWEGR